jgi:prevent-host-death family protein
MSSDRFVVASELPRKSKTLLRSVTETGEPCYITEDGRAKAVLMDIHRYNALMDLLEEAEHPELVEQYHVSTEVSVRSILERSSRSSRRKK